MPLGQFDERILLLQDAILDSAYTPGTITSLSGRASPGDNRADVVMLSNSDTVAHLVSWYPWAEEGDSWVVVNVPAGAGFDGTPPVDVLALAMPSANHYSYFPAAGTMGISMTVAPASGKFVKCWAMGGGV